MKYNFSKTIKKEKGKKNKEKEEKKLA